MIRINPMICAVILTIASGNVFASRDDIGKCNFPQHFKLEGPKGTTIRYIEPVYPSDFTVTPARSSSGFVDTFDVIDNTQCKGGALREIKLVVTGEDDSHSSDITFVDDTNGHGKVFRKVEFNGFTLKGITKSGESAFVMTYADE